MVQQHTGLGCTEATGTKLSTAATATATDAATANTAGAGSTPVCPKRADVSATTADGTAAAYK